MLKKSTRIYLAKFVSYFFLGVGALIMLIPFIWMLSTSLKTIDDVFIVPPLLFGRKIMLSNYLKVSDQFPFFLLLFNTFKISAFVLFGQLLTSSLAGFAFSSLRFRFKNALFLLYLASIMIPYHILLVPTFILMRFLKMLDTHYSLILPALISPFGAFLMRQFFLTIPKELGNAAKIDGCNPFGIYWYVFLPLSKPALTTLAIFTLVSTWNDFLRPLVFINNNLKMTLTLGIYAMQGNFATDWPVLMSVVVLSLLPVMILFLAAQDMFVRGVTLSGMKA
jgi:multiple sugar transport system permease protein